MHDSTEITDSKKLAAFVAKTRFGDVPSNVVGLAKDRTLDMLGCFVYGREHPGAAPALEVVRAMGGAREATVAGEAQKVPAPFAALANGTASHCFEMDDRQPESGLHAGSILVPAALAMAENESLAGPDYLTALTVGHEVACRIGAAVGRRGKKEGKADPKRGFHGTGSWSTIGAAAAAAKAMQFSASQVEQAMAISTATGFAIDWSSDGAGAKGYNAGKAAMGGVLAARLVQAGMVGPENFLEWRPPGQTLTRPGYLALVGDDVDTERMLRGLGESYEFERGGTKRYACDGCLQSGIDALRRLVRQHDIKPEEIRVLNVHTMSHVAHKEINVRVGNAVVAPQTPIDAMFSYPHVLAVALIDGDVTPAGSLPVNWNRPEIEAARQKVHLFVDPEYDARFPPHQAGKVEIVTDRGSFQEVVMVAKGSAEDPLTWEEQVEKFMVLANDRLAPGAARQVVEKVWELEQLDDVNELTALLRPQQ